MNHDRTSILRIDFIRHGATAGNLEKRYIGTTDEPLCRQGITALQALQSRLYQNGDVPGEPHPDFLLISSPMQRCIQTAEILYPHQKPYLCHAFRECDFGDFENRNYLELSGNPAYQDWINSGGTACFPHGESPEAFKIRVTETFAGILEQIRQAENHSIRHVALTVHGGTIMAILEKFSFPQKGYYAWQLPNACAYRTCYTDGYLQVLTKITPESEINC